LVFLLVVIVFQPDLNPTALQYYSNFASIPLYAPSAVNALVAILLIGDYRRTLSRLICGRLTQNQ
jgi:hypothetical protein